MKFKKPLIKKFNNLEVHIFTDLSIYSGVAMCNVLKSELNYEYNTYTVTISVLGVEYQIRVYAGKDANNVMYIKDCAIGIRVHTNFNSCALNMLNGSYRQLFSIAETAARNQGMYVRFA